MQLRLDQIEQDKMHTITEKEFLAVKMQNRKQEVLKVKQQILDSEISK